MVAMRMEASGEDEVEADDDEVARVDERGVEDREASRDDDDDEESMDEDGEQDMHDEHRELAVAQVTSGTD